MGSVAADQKISMLLISGGPMVLYSSCDRGKRASTEGWLHLAYRILRDENQGAPSNMVWKPFRQTMKNKTKPQNNTVK